MRVLLLILASVIATILLALSVAVTFPHQVVTIAVSPISSLDKLYAYSDDCPFRRVLTVSRDASSLVPTKGKTYEMACHQPNPSDKVNPSNIIYTVYSGLLSEDMHLINGRPYFGALKYYSPIPFRLYETHQGRFLLNDRDLLICGSCKSGSPYLLFLNGESKRTWLPDVAVKYLTPGTDKSSLLAQLESICDRFNISQCGSVIETERLNYSQIWFLNPEKKSYQVWINVSSLRVPTDVLGLQTPEQMPACFDTLDRHYCVDYVGNNTTILIFDTAPINITQDVLYEHLKLAFD